MADLCNGVTFPDVGKKLIAQPLTLAGALHQPGNIHKLDRGRHLHERRDESSKWISGE
jgi:hypothetical protein